jgi:precorrin-3B C17-methyltransferase
MKTMTKKGKLLIVGIGPGDPRHMTTAAREAITGCDYVVGYKTYIKLIEPLVGSIPVKGFGMTKEVDRAQAALDLARAGFTVALVSSGDAGMYGMAGLCFELLRHEKATRETMPHVTVIPGVTSANSSASLVGAPLMHDCASISLSDLLTPLAQILRRIEAAASADFVITLYNPASKKRREPLEESVKILKKHRAATTPVALVEAAYRSEQNVIITDLAHLMEHPIGMTTTIIIGNSQSYVYEGFMLTPRGYTSKYLQEEAAPERP